MKKTYKTIHLFIVLLSLATMKLGAQALSGAYTIDQTIAASTTNFVSFNAFATALNSNGVSGPVSVNVVSGTGPYIEQVAFNQITGASGVNRIVINGNNNLITFNSSNFAAGWVMNLNGTDFLTVNNLQMSGTGSYAYVCLLNGGANDNVFSACSFSCPANTTSSNHIPLVISGANNTYGSAATSGNNNEFLDCTMFSGYFGVTVYGPTSNPNYASGNKFIRCSILDWYLYGTYLYYSKDTKVKNCLYDRPTRTLLTTSYGIQCIYNNGVDIDGNRFQRFYNMNQTSTSTCYAIQGYYNPLNSAGTNPNNIRNNIIQKMEHNGGLYGIYYYYPDGNIYNNTISFDYTGSTASSSSWGIYTYGNTTYPVNTRNNLITITRGGSGQKVGIYYGLVGSTVVDNNDIWVNGAGGNNNHGYYGTMCANLAAWQAAGCDMNGFNLDPMYVNLATNDLHPTNTALNNGAAALGVLVDADNMLRNPTTPDVGALEFLTPLCTGTPSMTVVGPSYSLCPGETADFGIGNLSADAGYTFQWQSSGISQVGPWTNLTGFNGITYSAPNQTTTAWYSCVISCTAPGGSSIQPVAQVNIAGGTTNNVTYTEGFENIGKPNRLPNCSWLSPSLGGATKTYTSSQSGNRLPRNGSGFATFDLGGGAGTNYYYTNGINMVAGITYSASAWYQSDLTGASNWSDISILVGSSQSSTGLTPIASSNGPAIAPIYKSLSNTFTIPASGVYYIVIRATSTSGTAQYLSLDDIKVEIPCTPTLNSPTIALGVGASTNVCAGTAVNLTASGANTYVWSTGSTASAITVTPSINSTYMVTGTSSLTGCSTAVTQAISVKPAPSVLAFAIPPSVCSGKSTNLTAQGQGVASYNWNVGGSTASIPVSPTVATTYTVIGTAQNGCSGQATVAVVVNSLPNVTGSASNANACKDDQITLTGNGAVTYNWVSSINSALLQGANVVTIPGIAGPASYTVTGTDNNGCSKTDIVNITVNACTGINGVAANSNVINVYPNPNSGVFTVELNNGSTNVVEVLDMTGRIVSANTTSSDKVEVNINTLASGVYYVRVKSATSVDVIKVVKQ